MSLVHAITNQKNWKTIKDCFKEFGEDERISCISIPVESLSNKEDEAEQVSEWWEGVEQPSVELAMDYAYVLHTDITDCYGSIYTHSIAWALHGKDEAKERRRTESIGNLIDKHIRDMNHGQTNGIPQGSRLMDFIAEMVLSYADLELSKGLKKKKEKNFKIIRYRDDYRIFTNNPAQAEHILKQITEIMIGLGMKINAAKTISSDDVITASIKSDKLAWLEKQRAAPRLKEQQVVYRFLQKELLLIRSHSKEYPNAGSLFQPLGKFCKELKRIYESTSKEDEKTKKWAKKSAMPMISIAVDIALHNPRAYSGVAAILSYLVGLLNKRERARACKKIDEKFKSIPNTGYMEVWLQQIFKGRAKGIKFKEKLTQPNPNAKGKFWNVEWMKGSLESILKETPIVDKNKKRRTPPEIDPGGLDLFRNRHPY